MMTRKLVGGSGSVRLTSPVLYDDIDSSKTFPPQAGLFGTKNAEMRKIEPSNCAEAANQKLEDRRQL